MRKISKKIFENDELIIFNLLASGYTINKIAEKMHCSPYNINKKIKLVKTKLEAENKISAISKLISLGFIS